MAGEAAGEQPESSAVPRQLRPYCFKPGQSGNPAGRPPGPSLTERLRQRLRDRPDEADEVIHAALEAAVNGDEKFAKLVFDRHDGLQKQGVELEANMKIEERRILIIGTPGEAPQLPPEILALEEMRALAEDRAQVNRSTETTKQKEQTES